MHPEGSRAAPAGSDAREIERAGKPDRSLAWSRDTPGRIETQWKSGRSRHGQEMQMHDWRHARKPDTITGTVKRRARHDRTHQRSRRAGWPRDHGMVKRLTRNDQERYLQDRTRGRSRRAGWPSDHRHGQEMHPEGSSAGQDRTHRRARRAGWPSDHRHGQETHPEGSSAGQDGMHQTQKSRATCRPAL